MVWVSDWAKVAVVAKTATKSGKSLFKVIIGVDYALMTTGTEFTPIEDYFCLFNFNMPVLGKD
jgi:hypothetical protein